MAKLLDQWVFDEVTMALAQKVRSHYLFATPNPFDPLGRLADMTDLEALSRLMAAVRPRLHRYCARMVGSVFEGEDIVQEALAKATEALPSAGSLEKAESWLFTIAHNTALDHLRRRKRQAEVPLESDAPELPDGPAEAEAWVGATASLATLMQLPPLQRSA